LSLIPHQRVFLYPETERIFLNCEKQRDFTMIEDLLIIPCDGSSGEVKFAPGATRTHDQRLRKPVLYPPELRTHKEGYKPKTPLCPPIRYKPEPCQKHLLHHPEETTKTAKTIAAQKLSQKTKRFSRSPLAIEKIFDTIEYTFEVQNTPI
jgi:hypothetical protein